MWIALFFLLPADPPEKLLVHPDPIQRLKAIRAYMKRE